MFFGPLPYAAAGSATGDADFLLFSCKRLCTVKLLFVQQTYLQVGIPCFHCGVLGFIGRPNLEDNQPQGGTLCYLTRQG